MIISVSNHADRIRLIAIETMKGAFGNEGVLRVYTNGKRSSQNKLTGDSQNKTMKLSVERGNAWRAAAKHKIRGNVLRFIWRAVFFCLSVAQSRLNRCIQRNQLRNQLRIKRGTTLPCSTIRNSGPAYLAAAKS
jgi:hypothetical protein